MPARRTAKQHRRSSPAESTPCHSVLLVEHCSTMPSPSSQRRPESGQRLSSSGDEELQKPEEEEARPLCTAFLWQKPIALVSSPLCIWLGKCHLNTGISLCT